MFRLTVLLCAGLYAAMLTMGQDNGQLRFGLMQAQAQKMAAVETAVEAAVAEATLQTAVVVETVTTPELPVVAAAFVPEKPLMTAVEVSAPATPDKTMVLYVEANKANVREGPGKDHAVIGSLPKGEAVLVLAHDDGPEGWSLIRIEGDGIEGYIASRLLRE